MKNVLLCAFCFCVGFMVGEAVADNAHLEKENRRLMSELGK